MVKSILRKNPSRKSALFSESTANIGPPHMFSYHLFFYQFCLYMLREQPGEIRGQKV